MNHMLQQSAPTQTLNPQLIEDIAAEVFWGYCFRTDYQSAVNGVLASDFGKLWTLKKAGVMLRQHDRQVASETVERCYHAVNAYMTSYASRAENIIGTLYAEDFAACRPPAFAFDDLIRRLRAGGDAEGEIKGSPPIAGDLLIRTPLPAVLLLREIPSSDWIQVADTRKALGFQKTMALMVRGVSPLPVNPQEYGWGATGVFQIPCGETSGPAWFKLMPNSTACRKLVLR